MSTSFRLPKGSMRGQIEANAIAFIASLPDSKAWRIEIKQDVRKRSDEQNRYYWGVVIKTISDAAGFEAEDVHEWICGAHFGWVDKAVPKSPNFPSGICSRPRRTTTRDEQGGPVTLSKIEFMELVEFCQRFAAHKGIYIPSPGEA